MSIDNLYNSGLSDNAIVAAGTNQTDYAQLKETGRCPLAFDLEYFLNSLAENSQLVQTTNANQFKRIVTITVTLNNIDISILSADTLEMGTYETIISY